MLTDNELFKRQQFGKAVAHIEGLPQEQRWRLIKDLLFAVKPEFVPLDKQFVEHVKFEREQNMINATGASKSGDMRALFSMPQYLYAALHALDPDFTAAQEDPERSTKLNLKLAQAFPEYRLSRKI
jgi:hypothetical protein